MFPSKPHSAVANMWGVSIRPALLTHFLHSCGAFKTESSLRQGQFHLQRNFSLNEFLEAESEQSYYHRCGKMILSYGLLIQSSLPQFRCWWWPTSNENLLSRNHWLLVTPTHARTFYHSKRNESNYNYRSLCSLNINFSWLNLWHSHKAYKFSEKYAIVTQINVYYAWRPWCIISCWCSTCNRKIIGETYEQWSI